MNERLSHITDYVLLQRERQNIRRVDSSRKSEPSGEMFNEFAVLLDVQLLTTAFGHGAWLDLADPEIRDGVYEEVIRRERHDA